jgi:hypothetical protein
MNDFAIGVAVGGVAAIYAAMYLGMIVDSYLLNLWRQANERGDRLADRLRVERDESDWWKN